MSEAGEPAQIPQSTQVLIIGGGPGGYVAGIRAAQLGLDVTLVDPGPLGGTCLNVGCIPSKAIIHAADEFAAAVAMAPAAASAQMGISVSGVAIDLAATMAWKDDIVGRLNDGVAGLLTRAGATIVRGRARLLDGKSAEIRVDRGSGTKTVGTIAAEHVVIATGSTPIELPHLPFGHSMIPVLSSTEALALTEVPAKLIVVGGGYIGLELGQAFAKLGSAVTVVEAEPQILSMYDKRLTMPLTRALKSLGVGVLTNTKAVGMSPEGLLVEGGGTEGAGAGAPGPTTLPADRILVTVGRRPQTDGWGLDNVGLTMNGPFVDIDERCHTSMKNVWAIGDVTGEPMLAHRAMKQGEVVAEAIAGKATVFDQRAIPAIVFTDPEIVSVGLDPEQAATELAATGTAVVEGRFSLAANSRSMTLRPEPGSAVDAGFVRVLAREDNHLVVGIQAVGKGVAELATAFGLALEMAARLEDIADTIHAHPTIGEGLAEASAAALGHAVHG